MAEKRFKIAGGVKPLAKRLGACMATNAITVEGRKVGHMFREEPFFPEDSGWRFYSGSESQGTRTILPTPRFTT